MAPERQNDSVKRVRSGFLFFVLLLSLVEFGVGEDFWQKKPYQEWSEKECQRLLHDSPWADTFTTVESKTRTTQRYDDLDRAAEPLPELSYVAQIRSALPIRQALMRQLQLDTKLPQNRNPEQR